MSRDLVRVNLGRLTAGMNPLGRRGSVSGVGAITPQAGSARLFIHTAALSCRGLGGPWSEARCRAPGAESSSSGEAAWS